MDERGRGRSPGVGEGLSSSREAEGEDGEGFYIARSGRRPNLLAIRGVMVKGWRARARPKLRDAGVMTAQAMVGQWAGCGPL